jgi:dienelactone hydrolase
MRITLTNALACAVLTAAAHAGIQTKAIEYRHGEVLLEGVLVWDDAVATDARKAPGVLVCPEWWGLADYPKERARQLAGLGYVAFAADMYGKGRVTGDPKQASEWASSVSGDLELLRGRARAAYDVLEAQPMVDKQRLAAIGYCFGGSVALELARTGAALRCVIPFHASQISARGSDEVALAANRRITGTVIVCHGQDDEFVKPEELARFHAQMKAAKVDYVFTSYAGAVHAFTNPGADAVKLPSVGYSASADRRSWELLKSALAEAFAAR